ncbi:HAMP domain-containing histidine kinase [Aestuariibaculum sp. M13]|uniref:sensor histidine kinase n=1 Tax=Aestuariibaculum sp. M13 TaxID=2967132 RepID=UPI002159F66F|nr:HAMP domain-containing sensor histidine kinase [Aestuariibaculum sp. M13]MCR8668742.1 HAMP domain-containing histidine kinase [Aestuariibaculum sp. M13]
MKSAVTTKEQLRERIKELTCLYEVSTIIVQADYDYIEDSLKAIAFSLKKALQFPEKVEVYINIPGLKVLSGTIKKTTCSIWSDIPVFNIIKGKISAHIVSKDTSEHYFLEEEQALIDNISLKIGSLLERIEIKNNALLLKRQMERADRLAVLGELTAGIAHELNTPLANILGFAELLASDFKANTAASEDLNKIIQNAIFSREVVKKLMFFSCEMPQEMTMVNLVPNIKSAINLLDATFRKQQVKYIVKIEEEELWLRADTVQLTQIIFNLTMNAIYFSPKDSLVMIEAFQINNEIILKITDQGPGIPENLHDKLFQPFFTTKPTGEGSGLGLSVVHGIVSSHKGSITAKSNNKKGTIFEVRLPK